MTTINTGQNKAPLHNILKSSFANERAAKDFLGINGVFGSFTFSQVSGAVAMTNTQNSLTLPVVVSVAAITSSATAVQNIAFQGKTPTAGKFNINFGVATSADILFSDNAAAVQVKVRATHASLVLATVTGSYAAGLVVTFAGALAAGPWPLMIIQTVTLVDGGGAITITPTSSVTGVIATQSVSFDNPPTAGSWTLTYGAWTTGALAFGITNVALQVAIRALDASLNLVTVSGGIVGGFTITYTNVVSPVSLISAPVNTLVHSIGITIAGTNVQSLVFDHVPTAGTWTMTYGTLGNTGAMAFGANIATIQQQIRAIDASLALTTVTGSYAAGFVVSFLGVAVTGITNQVGSYYTVTPDAVDGAFVIKLPAGVKEIVNISVNAHQAKALADNSDIYGIDVSAYDTSNPNNSTVTCRFVGKTTPYTVVVPLVDMLVNFNISCIFSSESEI